MNVDKKKKRKLGILIVVIVGLLFTTGAIGFITVQNVPVITGTISVSAYEVNLERLETWTWDIGDPIDPDFDAATVKGTLAFSVIMTGDPVDVVKLTVAGISDGSSPGGWWAFTQGTNQQWTLAFDTTILNDGVYTFTLSYIIDIPDGGGDDGGSDVPMSTFGFVLDGDEIEIYIPDNLIIIAAGVILVSGLIMIFRTPEDSLEPPVLSKTI